MEFKGKNCDDPKPVEHTHKHEDRKRVDYPRMDHQEEYAAEVAPVSSNRVSDTTDRTSDAGRVSGYIGVALGILAMFMWSVILGPVAVILGFYAYSQGRKVSGGWSIGLGVLATIGYFAFLPFIR
ncbi:MULTISPECIES: hypothetical protein [Paenibacillus]|uniref:hypothetical protein n=1 Tax=Paenibacillus TaxID=44249 RepID=UPI00035C7585|nr:hypothetical protein [Paenibacillus massiliensis]